MCLGHWTMSKPRMIWAHEATLVLVMIGLGGSRVRQQVSFCGDSFGMRGQQQRILLYEPAGAGLVYGLTGGGRMSSQNYFCALW